MKFEHIGYGEFKIREVEKLLENGFADKYE